MSRRIIKENTQSRQGQYCECQQVIDYYLLWAITEWELMGRAPIRTFLFEMNSCTRAQSLSIPYLGGATAAEQ